ncbi:calcium-binding protein [Streptomyces sp. NBC_01762]|uniref:calcium-binding protein n=1 Tax=unclassified Streptomyces TaxID=2593676 RepID=UPI002DD7AFE6|nr:MULTISPECIES: calcium-binding protein [unclassified Streptomyces]WSA69549.1 calcium-binding protein [Streptomyces sp. NBC_01800]WSA78035.1 calcium-binding protein [Streptomyces sp. NBC_01799]WSC46344.1 calcium-binding protein [Streptomyces sp. NBC_01762]WSD25998.1 calcium-binding protein [Streptomyces sp. NBC_01751]
MRTTTRLGLLGTSVALVATAIGATAAQAEDGGEGNITIDKVVVNGGKPVVVGTTKVVSAKVSVTASDDSGIAETTYISAFGPKPNFAQVWDDEITCVKASATTSTCTGTLTFDPQASTGFVSNSAAATWNLGTLVSANDYDYIHRDAATTFKVQRYSRLTTNASPEPVKKGKTITVTGLLSRANWDTNKYMGYTQQKVTLQYRKKTSSTYTNVKTVTSSSTGSLKTTVTASADGYFRYKFAGTSTTPAVTSTSDFVDVQ